MTFTSIQFAIFLPLVFFIYWALPHKFRWILLLISSYFFYLYNNIGYAIPLLLLTTFTFTIGKVLGKEEDSKKRKLIMIWGVSFCTLLLCYYKALSVYIYRTIVPVGLSFYTFQALAYIVDVYNNKAKNEDHYGKFSVFLTFFPQLVAGPIERTTNLLPQISQKEHIFSYEKATYGLKLMAWGFFKKLAIANVLYVYVCSVFDFWEDTEGFCIIIASFLFGIQIYADFSAYSDIARGSAYLFGIDLSENFKSPYFANSFRDFWNRWHISLTTWFRDYIYIPLGGNRTGKFRQCVNLMIVFIISGLWHGVGFGFIIWGLLHGICLVIESLIFKSKQAIKSVWILILQKVLLWSVCTFGWFFFLVKSRFQAKTLLQNSIRGIETFSKYINNGINNLTNIYKENLYYFLISFIVLLVYDYFSIKYDVINYISKKPIIIRWSIYLVLVIWTILNFDLYTVSDFIYFKF